MEECMLPQLRRTLGVLLVVGLSATWPAPAVTAGSEIVLQSWQTEDFYGRWARGWWEGPTTFSTVMRSFDVGFASTEQPPTATDNYIDYHFWARGGTRYRLWLRLRATDDSKWNDSVWVQFDRSLNGSGAPTYRLGSSSGLLVNLENCSACGMSGWGWQNRAWWLNDTGDVWFEAEGMQTMRVWIREDGVALDKIVVSSGTYLNDPPGPVRNDTSGLHLWKFDDNAPASAPTLPWPYDRSHGVRSTSLNFQWNSGQPCVTEEFYFGTTDPPPFWATFACTRPTNMSLNDGTTYFWRVVTYGNQGATAGPVWRFTTSGRPTNVVIYPTDFVSTDIGVPWLLAADPSGTRGDSPLSPRVFRTVDQGFSSTEQPPCCSVQRFDVRFWAEPNVPYHLWLRLKAENDSKFNDSVWVQFSSATIDGSPAYRMGTSDALLVNLENCFQCGVQGWGWQDSSWWRKQSAVVTFTGAGPHFLRFWTREDGVSVDQIVLSPSEFLTQRPGALKGDTTIVPKP
jgi:hypothetical protein